MTTDERTSSIEVVPDGVRLSDRYEQQAGRVHLTGIQALARLPLDQSRRDRLDGLRTGTYISGYEGSPLAGYDLELLRQAALLDEHDVTFEPGLNEEAAAMAVQGSQLIGGLPSRVEGVVGFWYGKAPGLDRATDALRHANLMGTAPTGGAVALVGDDPGAKSSSVPCVSERSLADLGMPTFYPADAGEILEMGNHAVALSRASGLWTALKIVTAVADGSASVDLLGDHASPRIPAGSHQHEPTAKLLQPVLGPLERDFMTTRMRIATDYARLNGLNRTVTRHAHDRVGIVTTGKTFLDVQEALAKLGLDESELGRAGIRVLKVGMIWPLEKQSILDFAHGLDEIIVVEEKRAFLETSIREILYGSLRPPVITGKLDDVGDELFAAYGELDADGVALGLATRLATYGDIATVQGWLAKRREEFSRERLNLPLLQRAPYFCSGCPHNTSTKAPEGSLVGAGIGCHAMVLLMDSKQVGEVIGLTQMGGEGTQWLGMAPFVEADHFVQNLGDGTFHHSGSLAIRAAVASGTNITYRLLYNSTVAMTGGQDAVGQMDVARLVDNLRSEGVARIIVTTEDTKRTRKLGLPRDVKVWDRSRIADAEAALAATPGVTILIHDQECATELRRKRKRGKIARPTRAIVINERLCEGCGDCGEKSNCLSVHPVETEFGRKTTIHQSSCNADYTCLKGDCPAFMSVEPGHKPRRRNTVPDLEANQIDLPTEIRVGRDQEIRLMGVGGTGVVTTSQVLATAALMAGRHVRTLDQTGVAQKGGAVVSDVKFSTEPINAGNKIGNDDCDLYLGYDLLVAADPRNLSVLSPSATAVVSTSVVPTGAMVSDKNVAYPDVAEALSPIAAKGERGQLVSLDARAIVEVLFGAEQFANLFLIGIAYQSGALSLSDKVIEEAISLNGVAVDKNVQAFRRGRQYVSAPDELAGLVRALSRPDDVPAALRQPELVQASIDSELGRLVARRTAELEAYQNRSYALRYERLVEAVRIAEDRAGLPGTVLAESVARYFFKLLAYKDEYEVARLARDPKVRDEVEAEFGEDARIGWKLQPPTLRALGMRRKITLGSWFGPAFSLLHVMRILRGTAFDPFGHAHVRKVERRLIRDYEANIERCLRLLDERTVGTMIEIAGLPDMVRGYEHVKLRNVEQYDVRLAELLEQAERESAPLQKNHPHEEKRTHDLHNPRPVGSGESRGAPEHH